MGAVVTAVTPRVPEMLNQGTGRKTDISERELQKIAKAMNKEQLADIFTLQRSAPYNVEKPFGCRFSPSSTIFIA